MEQTHGQPSNSEIHLNNFWAPGSSPLCPQTSLLHEPVNSHFAKSQTVLGLSLATENLSLACTLENKSPACYRRGDITWKWGSVSTSCVTDYLKDKFVVRFKVLKWDKYKMYTHQLLNCLLSNLCLQFFLQVSGPWWGKQFPPLNTSLFSISARI